MKGVGEPVLRPFLRLHDGLIICMEGRNTSSSDIAGNSGERYARASLGRWGIRRSARERKYRVFSFCKANKRLCAWRMIAPTVTLAVSQRGRGLAVEGEVASEQQLWSAVGAVGSEGARMRAAGRDRRKSRSGTEAPPTDDGNERQGGQSERASHAPALAKVSFARSC